MGKHGMKRRVYTNGDPTFDTVLGKFRKEAKVAAEKKEAWLPLECWQPPER